MVYAADSDSVLTLTAHYQGPMESFDAGLVMAVIKKNLSAYGRLTVYEPLCASYPIVALRTEFADNDVAEKLLAMSPMTCAVRSGVVLHEQLRRSRPNEVQGLHVSLSRPVADDVCQIPGDTPEKTKIQQPVIVSQPEDDEAVEALHKLTLRSAALDTPAPAGLFNSLYRPSAELPAAQVQLGQPSGRCPHPSDIDPHLTWPAHTIQGRSYAPMAAAPSPSNPLVFGAIGSGAVGHERPLSNFKGQYWTAMGPQPPNSVRSSHRRESEHPSCHHNVVDIERIRKGLDVRTTVSPGNPQAKPTSAD